MSLQASFAIAVGTPPEGVWAAPGRVNVIGEHTDYSDGFVLPMALPQVCQVAASARDDGMVRIGSLQRAGEWFEFPVSVSPVDADGWAAYPLGVVWALRRSGLEIPGVELLLDSDVPPGAGLSSSAAVGCSTGVALRDLFSLPATDLDLAGLARQSDNEFVGAPTGAMDQAISMLGRRDHLLFLDTRDMSYDHVPFALAAHGLTLLVIDSRVRHELSDGGGYASVRGAVEEGTAELGVRALRDVSVDDLPSALPGLEPDVARRVRHVVTENDRVQRVVALLRDGGDPRRIGPLLLAGHESLRDDFGISTPELDTAVDAAMAAGAAGARMTGGGFGGSVIALVDSERVDEVREAVDSAYAAADFTAPGYLVAEPSGGAPRLS